MLTRTFRVATALLFICLALTAGSLAEPSAPAATPTPNASPTPKATPSPTPKTNSTAEETVPAVNPYGPTVTTTATLTNVGIPEFETYYYSSQNPPGSQQLRQTPFLIKYTFDPRWEVNLGGPGFEQLLLTEPPANTHVAFGDPVLGLKYLLVAPANPKQATQALQIQYKFPISNPALGLSTGRPDQQLTYFYSQDYGKFHLDLNLWTSDLGAPDGSRRIELGQGVGLTVPVPLDKSGNLTFEGEWHNFARAGGSEPAVSSFMGIFYYSVNPRLSLASGVDMGLTEATPRRTYIIGMVFHFAGKR